MSPLPEVAPYVDPFSARYPVTVWPHKMVSGCTNVLVNAAGKPVPVDDKGDLVPRHPVIDTPDAFAKVYTTDAHFVPYVILGPDGRPIAGPRVNKAGGAKLAEAGFRIRFTLVPLDVDSAAVHGSAVAADDEWRADQWAKLAALEAALGARALKYDTRGGLRAGFALATWLDEVAYLELLAGVHAFARDAGLLPDRLVDAQRCYRLPFVTRDGQPQQRRADLGVTPLSDKVVAELRELGRAHPLREPKAPRHDAPVIAPGPCSQKDRPGDWLTVNVAWREILEPHGWQYGGMSGEQEIWYRPGKAPSGAPSALTNYEGGGYFFVFTTNSNLEPQRAYDKLGALAALEGISISDAASLVRKRWSLETEYPEEDVSCVEYFFEGRKGERPELAAVTVARQAQLGPNEETGWDAAGGPNKGVYEWTQAGNAARFVAKFGHMVRYVGGSGWRVWDGKRWELDLDASIVLHLAHGVIRDLDDEGQGLEEAYEKKHRRHREATASSGGLSAIVKLAAGYPGIRAKADDFDRDGWLLNTPDGTIDLRPGGEMRPHCKEDLITKMSRVSPDFGAVPERFDRFMLEVMPDAEDRGFLQRFTGYSLTGVIRDHMIPFQWGSAGRNGKTTYYEHLGYVLGSDYASTLPSDALMEQKGAARHPAELEVLRGRRIVWASEPPAGRKFNFDLLKRISGGDTLQSRAMNQNFSDLRATAKLTVLTNPPPNLRGADKPFWTRVRMIPWSQSFEGREEKDLTDKLQAEAPGTLARMIQWCREWQREGLGKPTGITEATEELLRQSDPVQAFVRERCEAGASYMVTVPTLHAAFCEWVKDIDVDDEFETPDKEKFGRLISRLGYRRQKSGSSNLRLGLRLLAEPVIDLSDWP